MGQERWKVHFLAALEGKLCEPESPITADFIAGMEAAASKIGTVRRFKVEIQDPRAGLAE